MITLCLFSCNFIQATSLTSITWLNSNTKAQQLCVHLTKCVSLICFIMSICYKFQFNIIIVLKIILIIHFSSILKDVRMLSLHQNFNNNFFHRHLFLTSKSLKSGFIKALLWIIITRLEDGCRSFFLHVN